MGEDKKTDRAEYLRKWREKHRDRLNEYQAEWRKAHPDKVKEYQARYYLKKVAAMGMLSGVPDLVC